MLGEQHDEAVAALTGARLSDVRYYPLTLPESDGVEEWDFGPWHQPTMGVELRAGTKVFSAVWGWTFGCYGLELDECAMDDLLSPSARQPVSVNAHPCWAPLIGGTITASTVWVDAIADGRRTPAALRMSGGSTDLWIAAAAPTSWPPTDEFLLGTDDVMVVFDRAMAASLGIV